MPLTEAEIKSIGSKTGKNIVIKSQCKERAQFVLKALKANEEAIDTIVKASVVTPKRAKIEMIENVIGWETWIRGTFPDSPTRETMINGLERAKTVITEKALPLEEPSLALHDILEVYRSTSNDLVDMMLTDFKQCECDQPTELEPNSMRSAAPAVKNLPTRYDVKVTVWEERDRLHIGIVDKATEQISYFDWWDDDARQMFEDGFFSHKHGLENSVLDYAEDMGILAK